MISDQMIKDRTTIHGNIDSQLVSPHIKLSQDKFVEPILGTALFNKILSDIFNGTISGDYKTLLDDYIVDCLVWYTLSSMPIHLSFQFWNKGVVRNSGEDTEVPSMSELIDISNDFKNNAQFYANKLYRYLQQNAPAKFPEYLNPGIGYDVVNPSHKPFSMPVYLGDIDECPSVTDPNRFAKMYQGNQTRCCD